MKKKAVNSKERLYIDRKILDEWKKGKRKIKIKLDKEKKIEAIDKSSSWGKKGAKKEEKQPMNE